MRSVFQRRCFGRVLMSCCLVVLFCGNHELSAAEMTLPSKPFIVTAYCQHGITKSGIHTAPGIVAADPDFLPLGSVVSVAHDDSRGDAIYTVADTGSKVKGHHIDVFTADCGRAKQFGRRLLQLTVLRLGWHKSVKGPRLPLPGQP